MPDATNTNTPPSAPPSAPAPVKITPVFRGQKMELDLSKPETVAEVTRLVQIAKNDEFKREQMNQRLAQLEAQGKEREKQLAAWNEIETFNRSNPVAGKAWAAAYDKLRHGEITPEQLFAMLNGKGLPEGDGSTPAPTSAGADPQTRAELAELKSLVTGMATELQSTRAATAVQDRLTQVNAVLASDPFLSDPKRAATRGLVVERILAGMERGQSLDESYQLETQRIRDVLSESATAEVQRRQEGETMRTIPANAGTPPVRDYAPAQLDPSKFKSPDAYMRESWKQTRAKAQEFARATMRAAVQGPNQ